MTLPSILFYAISFNIESSENISKSNLFYFTIEQTE